jgi:hypothetical protein
MNEEEFQAAVLLGRFGMISRGVVFTLTGWFIFQAALHRDPGQARGFGAAIEALLGDPAGHLTVALVGLGFVSLALHSFANARWVRMNLR